MQMNKIVLLMLMLTTCIFSQSGLRFSNYGIDAPKGEGDDNNLQVINIIIDKSYKGKVLFKIFDMNCGGTFDLPISNFNSTYRFSLYKGELKENIFLVKTDSSKLLPHLIKSIEVKDDFSHEMSWSLLAEIVDISNEDKYYSILVESVSGDDGNVFQIGVFSESNELLDKNYKVYSFEPTLILEPTATSFSFRSYIPKNTTTVNLHTFDLDNTNFYVSTILFEGLKAIVKDPKVWNKTSYEVSEYEQGNFCSIDYGMEKKKTNVCTFYLTDDKGINLPIDLSSFIKPRKTIPTIVSNLKYKDCYTFDLDFSKSKASNNGALSFLINLSDGFETTKNNFEHRIDKHGNYSARVYLEEQSNAITRAKLEKLDIIINEKPNAIAGKQIIAAPNENILFDGSLSSDNDGKIVKFMWNFGDGNSSQKMKPTHSYKLPGTYKAILKVEDNFQSVCNSDSDSLIIVINSQPIPITNLYRTGAANEELTFDASNSKDNDGEITKYLWDFGSLGNLSGEIVKMRFPKPGDYKVKLFCMDNSPAKNNTASLLVNVKINFPPVANAGSDIVAANNENIFFDASKSYDKDGKLISYTWDFGNGSKSSLVKPTYNYDTPGKYFVKLIVQDDSQTLSDKDSTKIVVTVNARPKAVIENERLAKTGEVKLDGSKSFDNDGSVTKYEWDFGDGNTGLGSQITHNYSLAGTYRIILKVIDNTKASNNFDFDTSFVTINKRPIADSGPDHTIAPNDKVTFKSDNSLDPDGNIIKREWYINNSKVSDMSEFIYQFKDEGTFIVGLVVTDDFVYPLSGIDYAIVKVNKSPVININAPIIAAPNQKVKFDATNSFDQDGSIIKYEWKFSDGTSSDKKIVEKTFTNPGSYSAQLAVYDNSKVSNSVSSKTVNIKINSSPVIVTEDFIAKCTDVIHFDASASFDGDGDKLSFTWDFPNAKKVNGTGIITHKFIERGVLPVILTVDDGHGLSNSIVKKTIIVKLHHPPIANAGNDTTVCVGELVLLNGQKSIGFIKEPLEYEWIFEDSTNAKGSNIVKIFKKGGVYKVTLRVKDSSGLNCNEDIDTKLITVLEAPIANAGDDITACANSPVRFDGSKSTDTDGLINSYEWDFGDGETGGGVSPFHIYNKPGVYKTVLTVTGESNGNCNNSSRDEITVTITAAPNASFTSRDSIPVGYSSLFDASASNTDFGTINNYKWTFSDGKLYEGRSIKRAFNQAGVYTVSLKITTDANNLCNSSEISKTIYVNNSPTAKANSISTAGTGQLIKFDASKSFDIDGNISSYLWDFGDGTKGESIVATHSYQKGGSFIVVLTVFDNTNIENNYSKDSLRITINESPKAVFAIPEDIYLNSSLILDASSSKDMDGSIESYKWFINNQLISTQIMSEYTFKESGLFNVRLLVEDNSKLANNINEVTKRIIVRDFPKLEIDKSIITCVNQSITLTPKVTQRFLDKSLSFFWKDEFEKIVSTSMNYKILYSTPGIRRLRFSISNTAGAIIAEDTIQIDVRTPLKLKDIPDTTVVIGKANDEVLFDASKYLDDTYSKLKIKWLFGDGTQSESFIVLHRYKKEGTYRAELIIDDLLALPCSVTKKIFVVRVNNAK